VWGVREVEKAFFFCRLYPFLRAGIEGERVIEMTEIGNDEKGKENPSRLQPTILIHRRHLRDGKKKKKLKRL